MLSLFSRNLDLGYLCSRFFLTSPSLIISNCLSAFRSRFFAIMTIFPIGKESWLVNGMMDYFSQTNSSRIVDILVKVQTPHDTFIFDRLAHWMHGPQKNLAITLFGHIVKNHPSWLYKVANHQLFKDILRLLRVSISTQN